MKNNPLNITNLKAISTISTLDALHRHLPKLVNVPPGVVLT
jgi:hypothetical protein